MTTPDMHPATKFLWRIASGAVMLAIGFVIGAFIMLLIWNNGIAHVADVKSISFTTAFWLNVGIVFIGNRFKSTSTTVLAQRPGA